MSKYFVKYGHGTKCKNSAESEANEYIRTLDGTLLSITSVKDEFIKNVKSKIDCINLKYRRCRDVRYSTWNNSTGTNISLGDGIGYLYIYKVQREE